MLAVLLLVSAVPAGAATVRHDGGTASLDTLFDELKHAPNADAAKVYETDIIEAWRHSGDVAADTLLSRGIARMELGDYSVALEILDSLIEMAPGFAEAWNTRATLYYLMGDYETSVLDIRKTLDLEPRHFGALSGLGLIMARLGNEEGARKAFEAALKIHPFLRGATAYLESLEEKQAGTAI